MERNMDVPETAAEKQRRYHKLWRENNRDRLNAICRKASAIYYEKNKEKKNKADLERYYRKKIEKIQNDEKMDPLIIV